MSSKAERQVLVGLQAAAGTGVNVDTALRATCGLRADVEKVHPEEDIGSFAPARHYVAQVRPEGTITLDGTYEQAVILAAMALGEPTPVGSEDPWTWTFPLPDVTDDLLDFALWSLEYTDGNNAIVRAVDVFAKALTISGEAGRGWIFEADLDGGSTTFPAALTATPAIGSVTPIRMADTTLRIDAAYDDIGTTTVEELISFTWKLEEFQHAKQFAGSLYPNGRGNGRWKLSLELILEAAAAEAETLRDALLATTQYAIQLRGYASASDYIYLDGMYMIEEVDTLDDRDGNNILKIMCLGEKNGDDDTGQVQIVTNNSAL